MQIFRWIGGVGCGLAMAQMVPGPVFGAEAGPGRVRIESVTGAKTVLLLRGLALREGTQGQEVEVGERIRTDAATTVVLAYSDGSHMTVLPNADLEIQAAKGGVQQNELHSGAVRGAIQKTSETAPKKPIKFVIRTKTAVMGVRGTEFVAALEPSTGLAQFHTLEGTVEVATSPGELMSGSGVPVSGGQFVAATPSEGLSAVQTFNRTEFLNSLTSAASNGATTGFTQTASAAASSAASTAAANLPSRGGAVPPPTRPPEPAKPVELSPAVVQQKAAEEEGERPHMHLLSFSLGAFFAENPRPDPPSGLPYYRAFSVMWTPTIPLPVMDFLYARASIGATLFENYSLNNTFLIHEYQAFAGTTILHPLFVEVGGGEQVWRSENIDAAELSGNAGITLSRNGRWNRIFVGASRFFGGRDPYELRAGIGIQLF